MVNSKIVWGNPNSTWSLSFSAGPTPLKVHAHALVCLYCRHIHALTTSSIILSLSSPPPPCPSSLSSRRRRRRLSWHPPQLVAPFLPDCLLPTTTQPFTDRRRSQLTHDSLVEFLHSKLELLRLWSGCHSATIECRMVKCKLQEQTHIKTWHVWKRFGYVFKLLSTTQVHLIVNTVGKIYCIHSRNQHRWWISGSPIFSPLFVGRVANAPSQLSSDE